MSEVLHRIYVDKLAKRMYHEDNLLVQIIRDGSGHVDVVGEMIARPSENEEWAYARYTIGAKDLRGGVSKSGVRNPRDLVEGCGILECILQSDWPTAKHSVAQKARRAQDQAQEGGDVIEDITILHTMRSIKLREDREDFLPMYACEDALKHQLESKYRGLNMSEAGALRKIEAGHLYVAIPPSRLGWRWYNLGAFDDYMAVKCTYPRYAYQEFLKAYRTPVGGAPSGAV